MKKIIFISGLLLFVSTASASIGTFTGELEKQGPEAEFTVGLASDQPLQVEIDVQQVEGLNISYNQSFSFNPEEVERSYQRGDEILPVREYPVRVESLDVEKEAYTIPVTFRAFSEESQSGTSPQVIHEREYEFRYVTDLSPSYGWNGSLIDGEQNNIDEDESAEDEPDETLNISSEEENTLTEQNQTGQQGKENESGMDQTTFLLIGGIMILTLYIIREAFA